MLRVEVLKSQFLSQAAPEPGEFTTKCVGIFYVLGFSKYFYFLVMQFVDESTFPSDRGFTGAVAKVNWEILWFPFLKTGGHQFFVA